MSHQEEIPAPEEIARHQGVSLVKALLDFEIPPREQLVLGSDPEDLSKIPHSPIKSLITDWAVVSIYCHPGDEPLAADLLQARPDLLHLIMDHALGYYKQGILQFGLNALTDQQIRNIRLHRSRIQSGAPDGTAPGDVPENRWYGPGSPTA